MAQCVAGQGGRHAITAHAADRGIGMSWWKLWLARVLAVAGALVLPASAINVPRTAASQPPLVVGTNEVGPLPSATGGPRAVPIRLVIAGTLDGLPAGTAPTSVEVRVDDRVVPVRLSGDHYEADVVSQNADAMVFVRMRAPRTDYQSNAGSLRRLKFLSGGDGRVDSIEASELRVSALTTAVAFLANRVYGRDPASQQELERSYRAMASGVGANGSQRHTVGELAAFLSGVTAGTTALPAPYATGTDLIRDPVAWASLDQARLASNGANYLGYATDASPIMSLSEWPDTALLAARLPVDQMATGASAHLVERTASDRVRMHFDELGSVFIGVTPPAHPPAEWQVTRTNEHEVLFTPTTRDEQGQYRYITHAMHFDGRMMQRRIIDRRLKRLVGGGDTALYASITRWTEVPLDGSAGPADKVEVDVRSITDLGGGSSIGSLVSPSRRALPTFCLKSVSAPASGVSLQPCDYQPYRLNAGGVGVIDELGTDVDAWMRPAFPGGGPLVSWTGADAGRQLRVSTDRRDAVTYWLLERQANGVDLLAYKSTHADAPGQTWVGVVASMPVVDVSLASDAVTGAWRLPLPGATVMPAAMPMELRRAADGSAQEYTGINGTNDAPFPARWELAGGRVFDTRYRAQFSNGTRTVTSCTEAFAQGASLCAPVRVRAFRALGRVGYRIYGRVSTHVQSALKPPGYSGTYTVLSSPATPSYYDCVAGSCLSTAAGATASSAVQLSTAHIQGRWAAAPGIARAGQRP